MLQIGQKNQLKVLKILSLGAFLDAEDQGEILLPTREMPESCKVGDYVDVFVSYDSEDRLVATSKMPVASVGEFAVLKVVAVEKVGAFLDWGMNKDLFLPFAEQSRRLTVGQEVIVYIYLDKSGRIAASMRLERNVDSTPSNYEEGQEVELLIIGHTDLGYKAIIEGRYVGVLFKNEVFQKLEYGDFATGYIKNIRPDGKIDLSLQKPGGTDVDDLAAKILKTLDAHRGFIAINNKTPASEIYRLFGVSKKKYKIALGGLYKKRIIRVDDDGIRRVDYL